MAGKRSFSAASEHGALETSHSIAKTSSPIESYNPLLGRTRSLGTHEPGVSARLVGNLGLKEFSIGVDRESNLSGLNSLLSEQIDKEDVEEVESADFLFTGAGQRTVKSDNQSSRAAYNSAARATRPSNAPFGSNKKIKLESRSSSCLRKPSDEADKPKDRSLSLAKRGKSASFSNKVSIQSFETNDPPLKSMLRKESGREIAPLKRVPKMTSRKNNKTALNRSNQRNASMNKPLGGQPGVRGRRDISKLPCFQPFKTSIEDFAGFVDKSRYKFVNPLGAGSYGKVYRLLDMQKNNKPVALKVIENVFEKAEDAKRVFRELFLMKRLRHTFIVSLIDVCVSESSPGSGKLSKLGIIMDYVDTDLQRLMRSEQSLNPDHIRVISFQLMTALNYLHHNKVAHRDLKPANILVYSNCQIKLCDFGLARIFLSPEEVDFETPMTPLTDCSTPLGGQSTSDSVAGDKILSTPLSSHSSPVADQLTKRKVVALEKKLTKHVVTRWYRAPELILLLEYSTKVDIWSAGCILAELLQMVDIPASQRFALFPGRSCFPLTAENKTVYREQTDQLNQIFRVIGTPKVEDYDHLTAVKPYLSSLPETPGVDLHKVFKNPEGQEQRWRTLLVSMLKQLLHFNPDKRLSAYECLNHDFFQEKKKMSVHSERNVRLQEYFSCFTEIGNVLTLDDGSKLAAEQYSEMIYKDATGYYEKDLKQFFHERSQ